MMKRLTKLAKTANLTFSLQPASSVTFPSQKRTNFTHQPYKLDQNNHQKVEFLENKVNNLQIVLGNSGETKGKLGVAISSDALNIDADLEDPLKYNTASFNAKNQEMIHRASKGDKEEKNSNSGGKDSDSKKKANKREDENDNEDDNDDDDDTHGGLTELVKETLREIFRIPKAPVGRVENM